MTDTFIPFAATDPDLVSKIWFRHDLQSQVETGDESGLRINKYNVTRRLSGNSTTTSYTPTHDSDGMTAIAAEDGSTNVCYYFDATGLAAEHQTTLTNLATEGAIEIEVDKQWLLANAYHDSNTTEGSSGDLTGSTGDYIGEIQMLLSGICGSSAGDYYDFFRVDSKYGKRFGAWFTSKPAEYEWTDRTKDRYASSANGNGAAFHSAIHEIFNNGESFVRLGFTWWGGLSGGTFVLAINGYPLLAGDTNRPAWTKPLYGLWLGCNRGGQYSNQDTFVDGHRFKNLIISTERVTFAAESWLSRIGILTDSRGDNSKQFSYRPDYTSPPRTTIPYGLRQYGLKTGAVVDKEYGGHGIGSYLAGNQFSDADINSVLGSDPTMMCVMSNPNDAGSGAFNAATYEADLKVFFEKIFFGTAYNSGDPFASRNSVEYVFIDDRWPRNDAVTDTWIADNQVSMLNALHSVRAWWNSTYPTLKNRIVVVPVWAALGSSNGSTDNSIGSTFDGLHPSYDWNTKTARAYAKSIQSILVPRDRDGLIGTVTGDIVGSMIEDAIM